MNVRLVTDTDRQAYRRLVDIGLRKLDRGYSPRCATRLALSGALHLHALEVGPRQARRDAAAIIRDLGGFDPAPKADPPEVA